MVFGIQEYEAEEEGDGYNTGGEDGRVDVGEIRRWTIVG